MNAPLPIVCLATGDLYGQADLYVSRLFAMLSRHCGRPFRLYCYTDRRRQQVPSAIIQRDCAGWTELDRAGMRATTRKLGFFNPAYAEFDEFLYLDLTLVVRKPMDELLEFGLRSDKELVILKDWSHGYNSSVMRIRRGRLRAIYDAFVAGATFPQKNPGDQDFIHGFVARSHWEKHVDLFPAHLVCSFKKTRQLARSDPAAARQAVRDATIVKFHGSPKMHDALGWRYRVRERMKELAKGRLETVMALGALKREWVAELPRA
jgi:hypothetical protein